MNFIFKAAGLSALLLHVIVDGAAGPVFQYLSFLPQFTWKNDLTNEQAALFKSPVPVASINDFQIDELILVKLDEDKWVFSQVYNKSGDTLYYWMYDDVTQKAELNDDVFDQSGYYKLSEF